MSQPPGTQSRLSQPQGTHSELSQPLRTCWGSKGCHRPWGHILGCHRPWGHTPDCHSSKGHIRDCHSPKGHAGDPKGVTGPGDTLRPLQPWGGVSWGCPHPDPHDPAAGPTPRPPRPRTVPKLGTLCPGPNLLVLQPRGRTPLPGQLGTRGGDRGDTGWPVTHLSPLAVPRPCSTARSTSGCRGQ